MATTLELSSLWVSVWNSKNYGLRAMPVNEALRDINAAIVKTGTTELHVIAVLHTLEACLDYNREIKKILKMRPAPKCEGTDATNGTQGTDGR